MGVPSAQGRGAPDQDIRAARLTGHSESSIRVMTLEGLLPYRVPDGRTRPKKVFPSQVLAVFGEGEA